jgi:hypothetical protein
VFFFGWKHARAPGSQQLPFAAAGHYIFVIPSAVLKLRIQGKGSSLMNSDKP